MNEYTEVADNFQHDVANHEMTVLHSDGLYRHLRFHNPDRFSDWFDLITWPGNLAVKGGHGGFMFARQDDMFGFFRRNGNQRGINPGYWAEKMPDCGRAVKEYSEGALRATLEPHLTKWEREQFPPQLAEYEEANARYHALSPEAQRLTRKPVKPRSFRELVAEYDEDDELADEAGARRMLGELETAEVVSDTWEWDLKDWDYHYLWSCHAIVWGIRQYDDSQVLADAAGAR